MIVQSYDIYNFIKLLTFQMPYFHHYNSDSLVNNKCCSSSVVAANQQRPNKNSEYFLDQSPGTIHP